MLYPLTSAQESLYHAYRVYGHAYPMNIGGMVDHPFGLSLEDGKKRLIEALGQIDILRTRFVLSGDTLFQTPDYTLDVTIEALAEDNVEAFVNAPFDLFGKLFRVGCIHCPTHVKWVFVCHHMLLDGHSLLLLASHVSHVLLDNDPLPLRGFESLTHNDSTMFHKRFESDREYFETALKQLPVTKVKPYEAADKIGPVLRINHVLNETNYVGLKALMKQENTSIQVVFESLLALDLSLVNGQNRVALGVTLRNRVKHDYYQLGMHTATLPFELNIKDDLTYQSFIQDIKAKHFEVYRHRHYPYKSVLELMHTHHEHALFDAMVITHPKTPEGVTFLYQDLTDLGLLVSCVEHESEIKVIFQFKRSLFHEVEAQALIKRWICRLDRILIDSNSTLKQLRNIVSPYQASMKPIAEKSIMQAFTDVVSTHKESIAVSTDNAQLSYQELDHRSNQVCYELQRLALKQAIIEIACLDPVLSVVALLGVYKSDNAYVFLPKNASKDFRSSLPITYTITDNFFLELSEASNMHHRTFEVFALYVTSGTTQQPKAIKLTELGLLNYVFQNKHYQKDVLSMQTILSIASWHFDISLESVLLALLNGKTLILSDITGIYTKGIHADFISLTPTHMTYLLESDVFNSSLKAVKCIVFGGEVLSEGLVKQLRAYTDARLYNSYGPTETSIAVTSMEIDDKIALGYPLDNVAIQVINAFGECLPKGYRGEMIVGKLALSLGYIHDNQPGFSYWNEERYYFTGDIGYVDKDDCLHFVSRKDRQIKRQGVRIELSAIETALLDIPGVVLAHCVYEAGKVYAYVKAPKHSQSTLYEALDDALPKAYFPNHIVLCESLRFNDSGKWVYTLPQIEPKTPWKPKGSKALLLYHSIKDVMQLETLYQEDTLLDYGLDSLQTLSLMMKLETQGYTLNTEKGFDRLPLDSLVLVKQEKPKLKALKVSNNKLLSIKHKQFVVGGSTGFLGMHVIHELLKHTKTPIFALVRKQKDMSEDAYFASKWAYYFNETVDVSRIKVIQMDENSPKVVSDPDLYDDVFHFDSVILNFAANIAYIGPFEDFYSVNVALPEKLAKIAQEKGIPLFHTSTLGLGMYDKTRFNETQYAPNHTYPNAYLTTKNLAEKSLLQMQEGHRQIYVVRVGNLMPRLSDFRFIPSPYSNAMVNLLTQSDPKSISHNLAFDFSPVDEIARAYVHLILKGYTYPIWHLMHPTLFTLKPFYPHLWQIKALGVSSAITQDVLTQEGFSYAPISETFIKQCIHRWLEKKQ